jgi:hypothetical protein
MTTAEAMQKIEGARFSAITNLASDFKTFLRILADQPEVKSLAEAGAHEDVSRQVFERILELAGAPVDGEYEHPADTALAAYRWLLSSEDSHLSASAAEKVLGCKQCWWSSRMAEHVLGVMSRTGSAAANGNGGAEDPVPARQQGDARA